MNRLCPFFLIPILGLAAACADFHLTYGSSDSVSYLPSNSDETELEVEEENDWVETVVDATSTFGADVDSGSYTLMRKAVSQGRLPEPGTVRVEEYVNYFRYSDPRPKGDEPFNVYLESAPSYFGHADNIHLLRIGLQAKEIPIEERDPVNLVFLIDVSGSMAKPE